MLHQYNQTHTLSTFLIGLIILLVTLGWSANSHAYQGVNFEIDFKHIEPLLKDSTVLNVDSVGLRVGEFNGSALRLDMFFGRLLAERKKNPATTTLQPDGYYFGVELLAETSPARPYRAGASINLSYNSANTPTTGQDRLELAWRQAEARLWASAQLGQRLRLYGCAVAMGIEGDQRHTTSGVTSVTNFKINQHAGYCGGLELAMPEEGFIGFEAGGQSLRGGRLYFGKHF